MTHYLTLESIWLISLSLFPYMHKYDSSFIISPMDMAILHAKLVWLSVATITTSFSIWLRLSIETLNQYSQNESWLRLSIETLNHPPKTTIVSSPSLFVTVTNEDRDWPVLRQEMIQNKPKSIASKLKIGIQVSVGIFDDSRVFFVYLDSFQVLRI